MVEDVREGIGWLAVNSNFIMEVVAGGATGASNSADELTSGDFLSRFDRDSREVSVTCCNAVSMGKVYGIAEIADSPRPKYDRVCRCADRVTGGGRDIDGPVCGTLSSHGIAPIAVSARNESFDRSN